MQEIAVVAPFLAGPQGGFKTFCIALADHWNLLLEPGWTDLASKIPCISLLVIQLPHLENSFPLFYCYALHNSAGIRFGLQESDRHSDSYDPNGADFSGVPRVREQR
jgi:hypothetical protein